jgi:glucose-6-phosphate isomerase
MEVFNLPYSIPVSPEGFQANTNMNFVQRHLSDMQTYFSDIEAARSVLIKSNPLIYEYWEMEYNGPGNGISFGMTRIQPGQVGKEYYFTKGHYHADGLGDEIHITLNGQGMALLMDKEGHTTFMDMQQGKMCYYPGNLAHRTINTGLEPLIFVGIWPPNIIHDYGTIADQGFPKLVVASSKGLQIIDNPNFKSKFLNE